MASPSAAVRLRESFGDRKVPDISRKITACVACRKLKIRCHMAEGSTTCRRCLSRNLPCTVNKSLQMLLESDASWKEKMEQRINELEATLSSGGPGDPQSATNPNNRPLASQVVSPIGEAVVPETQLSQRIHDHGTRPGLDLSVPLGAFPASSMLAPAGAPRNKVSACMDDLISRGTIARVDAEAFFEFYKQHLDRAVHHELCVVDSLAVLRERSSLLTCAICTVAACCMGSDKYHTCLDSLKAEASNKLFAQQYSFDDVRALCIGAMWLPEVSASLSSMAVGISTQLNLHRCITKMPHTKVACYERTRLYFLLYLCDHQCSLIHGRPPMTREWQSLKDPRAFLQSQHSRCNDLDLIAQVEFWFISRRGFERFGADIEHEMTEQRGLDLEELRRAYDMWRNSWLTVVSIQGSNDAACSLELHYNAGKLQLFSHAFRGPPQSDRGSSISTPTSRFAGDALDCALAIVRSVTEADRGGQWMKRLPTYFGTMIAFASLCLIKLSLQEPQADAVKRTEASNLMYQLTAALKSASAPADNGPPLARLANGLETALSSLSRTAADSGAPVDDEPFGEFGFDFDAFAAESIDLGLPSFDHGWLTCPDDTEMVIP